VRLWQSGARAPTPTLVVGDQSRPTSKGWAPGREFVQHAERATAGWALGAGEPGDPARVTLRVTMVLGDKGPTR
jgi:hypothetical protein